MDDYWEAQDIAFNTLGDMACLLDSIRHAIIRANCVDPEVLRLYREASCELSYLEDFVHFYFS